MRSIETYIKTVRSKDSLSKNKKNTTRHLINLMKQQEKRIRDKALEFSVKTYELLCLTSEHQLENITHQVYHK